MVEGVRILDLSHTLAGPIATMILADLGCEVIKVESPSGDETRTWAPHIDGVSAYFLSINRGKRSIVVNLKSERGREIIYRLVERSDVVVENYRAGVPERLGVDYKTLLRHNPELIYCSIKGFRVGSLYTMRPAYDIIIQAMSGLMATTGEKGRPPVRVSFALVDVFTGMMGAISILAALQSGRRPCQIEVPMYDVAIFSMCYIPMIYLLTGRKPPRMGGAHPSIVPYQAFRGGDGRYFILAAANDRLWSAACRALGLRELEEDPRFRTNPDRVRNRDQLIPILEKLFEERPRENWVRLFEEAGVPAAPVYELDEVFDDPHVKASGLVEALHHGRLGRIPQLASPLLIDGERPLSPLPPPLMGEHTEEVLRELGYSEVEMEELKREDVVYSPGISPMGASKGSL